MDCNDIVKLIMSDEDKDLTGLVEDLWAHLEHCSQCGQILFARPDANGIFKEPNWAWLNDIKNSPEKQKK